MNTQKIGNLGEKIARRYLENKGYKILDKNYCFRIPGSPQKGEIDIIAKKGDLISFFEVKTLQKTQGKSFFPEDKVNFGKRKRIVKTAEYWLSRNKIPLDSKWQINIIAITVDSSNKKAEIKHFKNVTIL